ncbi:TetR/AcrR family transcriptional regulator [Epibacterium sp. MM17-32]|uniref:TetR/AcrR family transcriptional regulator n=1 Tax=Epibacterium sp. MM17-32 TaxID=2917734 RepID=UPI001EF63035|nr:TetR/AcrR family transcriptional regulator [Epibacterium sp. MM17-32]MCG7626905.1 TetR/AcrR family transcriptional regulator [Epibacterium sp. MM17-32]
MSKAGQTRGRGRPRKFDERAVRQTIMETFWQKGYAATSLDDLSKATGLVRPSLYAAFGNKEEMFLRAMDDFVTRVQGDLRRQVPRDAAPEDALLAVFTAMLAIYQEDGASGARGCLVFSTAIAEAPMHPEIRTALLARIAQTDHQFRRLFDHLAPAAPEASRAAAADLAAATLHSLGLRVRAGSDIEGLRVFLQRSARSIASQL